MISLENKSYYIVLILYSIIFFCVSAFNIVNRQNVLFYPFILGIWIIFLILLNEIRQLKIDISNWIMISGFIIGLILNMTVLSLSDDIYRYLFDGYVIQKNLNPYIIHPDTLTGNTFIWKNFINNPEVSSPYPPLFLIFSYFYTLIFRYDIFIWRLIMNILTIATAFYLRKLLILFNLNRNFIVLWSLNPNVLIEFNHSGHNDVISIFFVVLGLYFLNKKDIRMSHLIIAGLTLSIAIGIKLFPIFMIPFLIKKLRILGMISLTIPLIIEILAFIIFQGLNQSGLIIFLQYWKFNSGIYELVLFILEIIGINTTEFETIFIIRTLLSITVIIVYLIIVLYFILKSREDITKIYFLITVAYFAFFLFNPVVHPWYLLWGIIPLIISIKKIFYPYWIWLILVNLSYIYYFLPDIAIVLFFLEYSILFASIIFFILGSKNEKFRYVFTDIS